MTEAITSLIGTIRWVSATEWAPVHDDAHTSIGIKSVEVLTDRLRVHYEFEASKVLALHATPDEQFASANVRFGSSVGLTYADVYCYMGTATKPVNPALLTKKFANIWLSGWFIITA